MDSFLCNTDNLGPVEQTAVSVDTGDLRISFAVKPAEWIGSGETRSFLQECLLDVAPVPNNLQSQRLIGQLFEGMAKQQDLLECLGAWTGDQKNEAFLFLRRPIGSHEAATSTSELKPLLYRMLMVVVNQGALTKAQAATLYKAIDIIPDGYFRSSPPSFGAPAPTSWANDR